MTINQLYKRLGKLIEQGEGRKRVVIDKPTFRHNCESDGVTYLDVAGLGLRWIYNAGDDGGVKILANGMESGGVVLVLAGNAGADAKGRLVEEPTE